MILAPGTKLGPYEMVAPLGAGGMGEVYRARDTRLERTVAIKILSEHLALDPDARERFDREARAISSLNHPNICQLYDIGEQDGVRYLVMEYLEGETLADRLRKGPLPPEQTLRVGAEICEGLERAHRSGVVHRDLKPGNIMLTKSGAKLMDFGLAKSAVAAVGASSSSASLTTMSRPLTAEGKIVGTFQYMSPEQVEGKDADARSDIFALGTVLYEMVTGKRAFEGKTTASTIAAILAAEPKPISAVQPLSPPAFEGVVKACLAKDPDERLQTAHDVKLQLRWIAESQSQSGAGVGAVGRRTAWKVRWWQVAGLFLTVLLAAGVGYWLARTRAATPMYFNAAVPFASNDVAVSQDGRMLAMVAFSDQANKYAIWTQAVGSRTATIVAGTEDAIHPFWSPDGRSIGFFAQGKLKRVDISSGQAPQVLCEAPNGRGGTWSRDGTILFSPNVQGGLYRISSGGGTPTEVTKTDPTRLETSHRWPVFLPDQKHFLYLAANFAGEFEKNAIAVGSLESGEKKIIVSASSNAAYAEPGYLLYWRDSALVAQRFDSKNFSLSGEAHPISDEVHYFPQTDLALFDAAGSGTLAIQTGTAADKSQLAWIDRTGKQVGVVGRTESFANPALSPDGRRLAVDQVDKDGRHVDIWIYDLSDGGMSRVTFGPVLNDLAVWSPDGKRIAFGSIRKLSWGLLQRNTDGSGSEQEIGAPIEGTQYPRDWSRDGRYILVWRGGELWYLEPPNPQPKPLFREKWAVRNAQFSPDGRWLAYSSNESGRWEVYVAPFPGVNGKWQVSRGGGEEPRWRRDGKELFYISADAKMMAVPVETGANFESGSPVALFQTRLRQPIASPDVISYDVAADGQKFLINSKVNESDSAPLMVVLNWAAELEK